MRQPATWLLTRTGQEISGCCPYQWWTTTDGSVAARGSFIDPKRKLVIASNANWAGGARDPVADPAREDCYRVVQKIIDDELAGSAKP